jgi:hypothetical protein
MLHIKIRQLQNMFLFKHNSNKYIYKITSICYYNIVYQQLKQQVNNYL